MPTPDHHRRPARQTGSTPRHGGSCNIPTNDWRCTRCDKLLGVFRDGGMHLRFARGHEYFVGFPVVATCRGCGTLNQTTAPVR